MQQAFHTHKPSHQQMYSIAHSFKVVKTKKVCLQNESHIKLKKYHIDSIIERPNPYIPDATKAVKQNRPNRNSQARIAPLVVILDFDILQPSSYVWREAKQRGSDDKMNGHEQMSWAMVAQ